MAAFARHGAATISSDEIVHELSRRPRGAGRAGRAFGTSDRAGRREVGIGERDALIWLEALLHPLRHRNAPKPGASELARLPDPPELAVNEVPLLYETGAEGRFDAVVVITAPRELRADRAGDRLDEREQRLIPDEDKVSRADFTYVNDGSLEELDAFVADVVRRLTS